VVQKSVETGFQINKKVKMKDMAKTHMVIVEIITIITIEIEEVGEVDPQEVAINPIDKEVGITTTLIIATIIREDKIKTIKIIKIIITIKIKNLELILMD
jgi:hypothetical protein